MSSPLRVAVIPARGGSKRIPRKNIREFCGKPIIAWSIKAALNSRCFDRVLVSTDDDEIADIASSFGAEIPFIRPVELSDDHAGTTAVIKHAIQWLNDQSIPVDYACCIYATAPFVTAEAIFQGWLQIEESKADFAFSVTSYPFPIQRAIKINSNQRIEMLQPEQFYTRSQDLEEAWHDAGQFYWGTALAWLDERPVFSEISVPVKVPAHLVQDIDTEEDWVRAELMFKAMQLQGQVS